MLSPTIPLLCRMTVLTCYSIVEAPEEKPAGPPGGGMGGMGGMGGGMF
jgi:hypothetical protein